ncbi:MAG: hypothetical protein LRY73_08320 [Bacillus sp. (in: Bacteria)]|nr:hypothetical protein [Bacillus sp. (in: firmicutes)]
MERKKNEGAFCWLFRITINSMIIAIFGMIFTFFGTIICIFGMIIPDFGMINHFSGN